MTPTTPSSTNPQPPRASRAGESRSAEAGPAKETSESLPPREKGTGLVELSQTTLPPATSAADEPTLPEKVKTLLIGRPRDLADRSVYRHLSLVAFLAWVGLGADGLSSSCYGPAEAFHHLGEHTYLAVMLAAATVVTVFVISACYSHIIEVFPSGGGGYVVASKLLGPYVGLASGSALLVDYVLTITVSVAAAGEALFGLFPAAGAAWKVPAEVAAIVVLTMLNLRGVKESVKVLLPIFLLFLATHFILILGAIGLHVTDVGGVAAKVAQDFRDGLTNPAMGWVGMLSLFLYAYSLGAGTYTGIEAVSNSMAVMHEPRVATGQRTMLYMAISLAVTASGLLIAYLLLDIRPVAGKTMNQLLAEVFVGELGMGAWSGRGFVFVTMLAAGALLIVAAQAGFIDGPRVLANMALDSWMPHPFANLSERLAIHNGVMLMGLCAVGALLLTRGNVSALVIMYSINVFLTFSLSMVSMCRYWYKARVRHPLRRRRLTLFVAGAVLCLCILGVTVFEKFDQGGWRTLSATGLVVALGLLIRRYYRQVKSRLRKLDEIMTKLPPLGERTTAGPDPAQPTAAVLVGGFGGLGLHTLLNAYRFAPGYFKNVVFLSAGVVDSGSFKGAETVDDLRKHTSDSLDRYVELVRGWGVPATSFMAVGTDAVDELEKLCVKILEQFPRTVFFAGQLVFRKDTWYQRVLHNQTAYALLRRLQWDRVPMVILPTRVE
jgi:amino acid transporter